MFGSGVGSRSGTKAEGRTTGGSRLGLVLVWFLSLGVTTFRKLEQRPDNDTKNPVNIGFNRCLRAQKLVGAEGFEPPTSSSQT